jgi:hypothetical protein
MASYWWRPVKGFPTAKPALHVIYGSSPAEQFRRYFGRDPMRDRIEQIGIVHFRPRLAVVDIDPFHTEETPDSRDGLRSLTIVSACSHFLDSHQLPDVRVQLAHGLGVKLVRLYETP